MYSGIMPQRSRWTTGDIRVNSNQMPLLRLRKGWLYNPISQDIHCLYAVAAMPLNITIGSIPK
jgi:hypothetical protein